jgi:TolB-like protein
MSHDPIPSLADAGDSPQVEASRRDLPGTEAPVRETAPDPLGKKKHKDKVRSAWISFIGRIVAQIAGATATIVLGLTVLNQYNNRQKPPVARTDAVSAAPSIVRKADRSQGMIAVAVLPFENFSGDATQEFLADGLTELVIGKLAGMNGLHVISRTSSMHYKGLRKTVPEIAAELGVDLIIEGSVARYGGRTRVVARLIDAPGDRELWSQTYERPDADVLTLQTEVAASIAGEAEAAGLTPIARSVVHGATVAKAR